MLRQFQLRTPSKKNCRFILYSNLEANWHNYFVLVITNYIKANWQNYAGVEQCGGGGRQKKAPCSSSNSQVIHAFVYVIDLCVCTIWNLPKLCHLKWKKSFTGLLLIPQGIQMKNWSQWWNFDFDTYNIAHTPSPFALAAKNKQKMLSWPRTFNCSLVKPMKKDL